MDQPQLSLVCQLMQPKVLHSISVLRGPRSNELFGFITLNILGVCISLAPGEARQAAFKAWRRC